MQTLDPPTLLLPELSIPTCEQVLPGNVPPETDEGHTTSGPPPEPLQGESEDPEVDQREGNEGAGT
jgi:hypothetical protein